MKAPLNELAQAFEEHCVRATRVWEPTRVVDGIQLWASRPVTRADIENWKEIAESLRNREI